jgi:type I restriction enzyme, S subunit
MLDNSWKRVILGELIDIKHGFAFKGEFFQDTPSENILLSPGNFAIGGGFKGDKFKYYVGNVPENYVLEEGDLLVTMTDLSKAGDTLGYPAFIPKASKNSRFLHNQRLGKVIILPSGSIQKCFLYYLLRTNSYKHEILASATGTTVKHTSPERIKAFQFLLPSLPEQKAIASILSSLDDKIELNQQMNRTLEAQARAIFKSWFVDFDPVRAKMEGRQPAGMDATTAALFPAAFEESELGMIPKGWKISTIGESVHIYGGSTPSTKNSAYWEGGDIQWATPKDLSNLQNSVLLQTERRITELGLAQIGSGLLPKGTVLLSSRAPIGYLAISEIPVAVNQGFIAMVCDQFLSNYYVLYWTLNNLDTIKGRANGTTFLEISKSNFRPISIIIPDKNILSQFNSKIEPLYKKMVSNIRESQNLATLRDFLLAKLMSGEIRVREAEKMVA